MASELRITDHALLGPAPDSETVTFTFDGAELEGLDGEPVAAALLANGVRAFRTMPVTGEPRGVFTGVGRSLEELGTLDGEANVPLMSVPVRAGMRVTTQPGLGEWEDGS